MRLSASLLARASSALRMPVLRVVTNLPSASVPEDFEHALPHVVAETMRKSVEKIWLEIQADARLSQGGSKEPCVLVSVKSIGAVSATETPVLTDKITVCCMDKLQIPKDKIAVQFVDMDPSTFARGGVTMAQAKLSQPSKQQ